MQVLFEGGTFFEGPRWHAGAWWVSDFYSHRVLRVTPSGAAETQAEVPNQPSGIGFLPDGSLLVVSMKDHRVLRRDARGQLVTYADLSSVCGGYANDMLVDRQGRAYVGNIGFDIFGGAAPAKTSIALIDTNGRITVTANDLICPNGMTITADGKTMIVAESFGAALTAFTIQNDGSLTARRPFASLGKAPPLTTAEHLLETDYIPDGCAIDAEDHVWVADALGKRVCRVAPNGQIVETLRPPNDMGVYACALGGVDNHTLLLCSAPDFSDVNRKAKPEAVLYTTKVAVPRGNGLP